MKLSEAVERLIAQAQEAVDEKARELEPERVLEALAAQGIHPPEGEALSDEEYNDLREMYRPSEEERERFQRELARRRSAYRLASEISNLSSNFENEHRSLQSRSRAFNREAKICQQVYGDLEIEQVFYFSGGLLMPWTLMFTQAAIIQIGVQLQRGNDSWKQRNLVQPVTVMHMLDDIDRVNVVRTPARELDDLNDATTRAGDDEPESIKTTVNAHRAGASGVVPFSWNWSAASGEIATAERFLGALAEALHRRAAGPPAHRPLAIDGRRPRIQGGPPCRSR